MELHPPSIWIEWLNVCWVVWVVIAVPGLLEALLSIWDGRRWAAELRQAAVEPNPERNQAVELIVPCAGLDPGLSENLGAYCEQEHPSFRLSLVVSHADDPAVAVIQGVLQQHPSVEARLIVAGTARGRGQKVHNLLRALEEDGREGDVLVFGDSDIRPHRDWMNSLLAGLQAPDVGASTGFRWYLAPRPSWASRLRAAWNSGIAGLLKSEDSPFAWGGAMAITRENFRKCRVADYWRNSLSDDLSLTRAVKAQKLRIRFSPRALSFSHEGCSFGDFWRWSFRQMAITRVYSPEIWRLAWVAQILNSSTVWGGLGLVSLFLAGGLLPFKGGLTFLLSGSVFLLGMAKSAQRLRAVASLFPEHREALYRDRWGYLLLGPVSSLMTLAALFRSVFRREIEWRGIRYRMVSSRRTEIIGS